MPVSTLFSTGLLRQPKCSTCLMFHTVDWYDVNSSYCYTELHHRVDIVDITGALMTSATSYEWFSLQYTQHTTLTTGIYSHLSLCHGNHSVVSKHHNSTFDLGCRMWMRCLQLQLNILSSLKLTNWHGGPLTATCWTQNSAQISE